MGLTGVVFFQMKPYCWTDLIVPIVERLDLRYTAQLLRHKVISALYKHWQLAATIFGFLFLLDTYTAWEIYVQTGGELKQPNKKV